MKTNPLYYKAPSGLEVVNIIEEFELDYHRAQAIQYILRASRKHATVFGDLLKAIWHLKRFLQLKGMSLKEIEEKTNPDAPVRLELRSKS